MGSFLFKWPHAATEVYVTGTFDDWAKSQKLEKKDGSFQKVVDLPSTTEKILYKFVVDDNWTTDHTAATEKDENGNINNVLLPEHIINKVTGTVGGATADLPGAWIETPAPSSENKTFSVNPIPATTGIGNPVSLRAGEKVPDASTLTSNTVQSTATTSQADYEKSASGAPILPNPITPQAEKGAGLFGLPEQTKNMIPESSLPIGTGAATEASRDPGVMISGGGGAPSTAALAGVVPLEPRREATVVEGGAQSLATQTGAGASTSALAGQVPHEPRGTASEVDSSAFGVSGTSHVPSGFGPGVYRGEQSSSSGPGLSTSSVPAIVRDSQAKAGVDPEASANPEALLEKNAVEGELKSEVPVEPATAGQGVGDKVAEIAAGAAAGATAAVAAAAAYATKAKDSIQSGEAQESAKATAAQAQNTASEYTGQAQSAASQATDTAATYASSAQNTASQYAGQAQTAASQATDTAATYASQAQETAAPYLAQAKDTAASATSSATAAVAATAASAKAALPESVQRSINQMNAAPSLAGTTDGTGDAPAAPQVPSTVKDSLAAAHAPAEAAVNPTQVSNKAAVERELHDTVLPDQGIDEPPGSGVPPTVTSSIAAAHVSPEAAASRTAVQEKAQVEDELLASVRPAQSAGVPAPTIAAATSETAPDALVVGKSTETPLTAASATGGKSTLEPLPVSGLNAPASAATTTTAANPKASAISRDVSPMTRPDDQTQPLVTSGVTTGATSTSTGPAATSSSTAAGSSVAPGLVGASATKTAGVQNPALAAAQEASRNPTQVAPGSPASVRTDDSATSKSSKRRSFFGRIKEKITHKKNGEGSSQQ